LRCCFISSRFVRVLDALGYRRFRHWRVYDEEALAAESLIVEHAGEPLSRYEVRVGPHTGELSSVARPRLFENSHALRGP
jgi:hypothetical protein